MLKWLKKNKGLTLLETVVAMLIISASAAGVLGSFSYAFKFAQRAGKKIEAANINRKAVDMYRAISIADPSDTRLAVQTNTDITSSVVPAGYDEKVYLTVKNWPDDANPAGKQINIKVDWAGP